MRQEVNVTVRGAVMQQKRPGQRGSRKRPVLRVRRRSRERNDVVDPPRQIRQRCRDHRDRRAVLDADDDGLRVHAAVRIGHLERHGMASETRERIARVDRRGIPEVAVAVEVPRVAQGLRGIRMRRAGPAEADLQRGRSAQGARADRRHRNEVLDPPDRLADDVDVEQIPARADRELDRSLRARNECLDVRGIRISVCVRQHHPDALARVVAEEERVLVGGRIGAARGGVESDA